MREAAPLRLNASKVTSPHQNGLTVSNSHLKGSLVGTYPSPCFVQHTYIYIYNNLLGRLALFKVGP